ncbi:hypothetical protein EUGRSUZ_F02102 [Eucalyptus grandis]|uniref:non-specific serine/threonine protein kinase n=2 Tax=Eucalyptus grandis TaxID=71139 RepID=A0A059BS47_EUCGR|nr:hypothetical protein EUGRSUZ_F02102 [Eucalyptus grandis]
MHGAEDASYLNCSSAIQCGGLQNVSYPFWGLNRPSYCGLPEFELTCQDNTVLINISNEDYRVLRIDGTSQMTVARNDYWETFCPAKFKNTTQEITNPFSYTTDTVASNLTLYYGCQATTITLATIMTSQFTCIYSGNIVTGYFLTKNVSDVVSSSSVNFSAIVSYFEDCNTSVVLAANQSAIQEIESSPSNTTLVSAIDEGFGLTWTVDTKCSGCLASGGQCGRDNSTGNFVCYCPDKPYSSACPDNLDLISVADLNLNYCKEHENHREHLIGFVI